MITRYEIAAKHPDGRAFLIQYTPRVSRPGILACMRAMAKHIIPKLAIGDEDVVSWGTKPRPFCNMGAWWIGFTGRTQIEAKQNGELPFIAG